MNAKWLEFFIICFFIQKHLESIRLDHTLKNEEQQNIHVANGENKYFVSTLQHNLKHQYFLF